MSNISVNLIASRIFKKLVGALLKYLKYPSFKKATVKYFLFFVNNKKAYDDIPRNEVKHLTFMNGKFNSLLCR